KTLQSDFKEDLIDLDIDDNMIELFIIEVDEYIEPIFAHSNMLQKVKNTLRYSPPPDIQHYLKLYEKGLNKKDKGKEYFRDYKELTAQCWCGNYLYSPSDKCINCYLDLKLWITIKSYIIKEVAKSYWHTPDKKDESEAFNTHFSNNASLINDTEIDPADVCLKYKMYLLLDYKADNKLPVLETPLALYTKEFSNFFTKYLSNSAWWIPNLVC
ncbi:4831_t:CDS:2, partial [Dentiscutata erythropus]